MPPPGMAPPGPIPAEVVDPGPFEDPAAIAGMLAGTSDEDLPGLLRSLPPEALPALIQLLGPFPQAQERVMQALLPDDDAPEDPWWYRDADYPKPDWSKIDGWVTRAEAAFRKLRQDMGVWEDIFFQKRSGLFTIDADDDAFERFWATAIRADTKLAINHTATSDLILDVTPLAGGGKEAAQRCEDAWHDWWHTQEERHSLRGNSSLRYDHSFIAAVRGRLAARQLLRTEDPQCPVAYTLLDPAAVYPAWDEYGIRAVAHVYQTTLGEAATAFADDAGTVRKLLKDAGPEGGWTTDQFGLVTVVEWWDRRWHAAKLRDGRVLLAPAEHGYAEVPWVYTIADTGRPAVMRQADVRTSVVRTEADGSTYTALDEEVNREIGLPLFADQMKHQQQIEALMSKNMQLARATDRPPVQLEQDDVAKAGNPDPEVSFEPGAINRTLKDNERLTPMQLAAQAGILQPLLGYLTAEGQRAYQPLASYGASAGVATGNAMEGQVEAGRDKELPLVATLERHFAATVSLTFRQLLRRGHECGREGCRGEFRVAVRQSRRRDEDAPQTFVLTPRTIKKAQPRCRVRLRHVELRNMPGFSNMLGMWQDRGLPIAPILELAGFANPADLMAEGMEEQLAFGKDATPLYRFLLIMEANKNPDGSWDPLKAMTIWNMLNAGQGQGGGMGGSGSGSLPLGGGGGGGLPVNTTAMNLSPQNFPQAGVGMGAGRPVSTGAGLGFGAPGGGAPPPAY